jgi:hypothetical protein
MNKSTQRKIREKNAKPKKGRIKKGHGVIRYNKAVDSFETQPWERRTRERMEIDMREIFLPACQREQQPAADNIEQDFDPGLLDAPLVNIRKPLEGLLPGTKAYQWESQQPQDRKYALTDGYQRITALSRLAEQGKHPWRIMVDTIQASVEYETWVFLHQDKFETRITRGQTYSSALATDHPTVSKIDEIVRRNGFYVPNKISPKNDGDIKVTSSTGPEECFMIDNEGFVLDRSLKIIHNCWSSYPKAGHHDIIKGVGVLVKNYGGKITPEVETNWRNNVQVGMLLEAAKEGTSQPERAKAVAVVLRRAAKITKKPSAGF